MICILLILFFYCFSIDSLIVLPFHNARFSLQSPQLVRLEYSPTGTFVDEPSLIFNQRNLPDIPYSFNGSMNAITISTASLVINYQSGPFTCDNLKINVILPEGLSPFQWCPGQANPGLMKGSLETTDCYDGADHCLSLYIQRLQPSLMSTSGWSLVNDTSPLLTSTWRTSRIPGNLDWYFFGHGLDFQTLLYDYTRSAGAIPLMPARSYGIWWSRYWPYNETGIRDVIGTYEQLGIPLNMLVLDINWHNSGPATLGCGPVIGVSDCAQGYGGYSWNKTLFQNPQSFQSWVHSTDLQLMLNIHDQCGIDHCQASYPAAAALVGIDPATKAPIMCKYTDQNYSKALFTYELGQPDNQNVDFWWEDYGLDMGPNAYYELNCVDAHCMRCLNDTDYAILWSSHLHVQQRTQKNLRGMVLGIYGGLGSHRYPIVGSGDTYAAWETLAFEVAMTVSAGNVGVGWTHDLGGFMGPEMRDPEMFLRWLQFGVFSYSFRTHCSFCEIRIWKYPNYPDLKETFLLRNSLIPYIYSAAYSSYYSAELLVTPLYFEWPSEINAYRYNGTQYFFGPDFLVAPITKPVDPTTKTVQKTIWFPPGGWVNYFTGETFTLSTTWTLTFGITDIPLYARAGAIIPMKYPTNHGTVANPLIFTYIYKSNWYSERDIYEDDGETLDYTSTTKNAYWISTVTADTDSSNHTNFYYSHTDGDGYTGQLKARYYEFHMRNVLAKPNFEVSCNGQVILETKNNTVPGWWRKVDYGVPVTVIAVGDYLITSDIAVKVYNH